MVTEAEAEVFFAKAQQLMARHAIDDVMLAGHEEHRRGQFGKQLLCLIELLGRREVRDVAGVDNEVGHRGQGANMRDRFAQRRYRVGIGGL